MNPTKIEWCDYTWNPVTGCKRGCPYCYARRIYERFNKTPFTEIQYHPSRMDDLEKLGRIKKAQVVFVGSMSDIEYWPKKNTELMLREIRFYHRHTFMFLSKNPDSYNGFVWPKNTMQGLTMTESKTWGDCGKLDKMLHLPRPFLSIEPLLGSFLAVVHPMNFEKVIVGAMTGPGAVKPKPEWIQSIKDNIPEDKIFWKSNIKAYL